MLLILFDICSDFEVIFIFLIKQIFNRDKLYQNEI